MTSHRLRIVVVDDHPVYRDGLRAIVEPRADIEVVGEAARGDSAVRALRSVAAAPMRSAAAFDELTEREHEVLALVADGFGNHRIAHRLSIAPKTVRNHVYNILVKLQASDRRTRSPARAAGLGAPDSSPGA